MGPPSDPRPGRPCSDGIGGVVLADAREGGLVDLGAEAGPTLLVLIRHRVRVTCQETWSKCAIHWPALETLEAQAMAVGFSPGALLAELATVVAWPSPFLSAPQRFPYTGCGFAEDACTTSTAGAIRGHLSAARRGVAICAPVEDTRQLGAEAVVVTSQAV